MNKSILPIARIAVLSFLLNPISLLAQDTASEQKPVASMQDLLKQLERQRYSDNQENKAREKRFLENKNEQQKILAQMQREQKNQEAISERLENAFEENDKKLVEAESRLKERMGSLAELFGHLTSAAGDAPLSPAHERVVELGHLESWLLGNKL